MERIRLHRDQMAVLAGIVLPLAVAGILVPFRSSFANTAAALILVAVIVAVAALGNRVAGFCHRLSRSVVRLLPDPSLREARHHPPARHRDRRVSLCGRHHGDRAGGSKPLSPCGGRRGSGLRGPDSRRLGARRVRQSVSRCGRACAQGTGSLAPPSRMPYESGSTSQPMDRIEHDGRVAPGGRTWAVHQHGLPGP